MIVSWPTSVRIWLALRPTDLRKSFDSLAEVVRQHLQGDPLSGQFFVFRNKRGDRVKLLYWDEDGFVILYKRLEAGTFRFPAGNGQAGQGQGLEIRAGDLQLLLDGIDLASVKRQRRYRRPVPA
jgi:transposase